MIRRSLMKTFYRAESAAIIVYDITREDTFADIDKEMKIISNTKSKNISIIFKIIILYYANKSSRLKYKI